MDVDAGVNDENEACWRRDGLVIRPEAVLCGAVVTARFVFSFLFLAPARGHNE